MGNGLSDKTCEDASSNGLLLASSVLQEMCVSQELLVCFDLFSLLGHSCHSQISHLVGIPVLLQKQLSLKRHFI